MNPSLLARSAMLAVLLFHSAVAFGVTVSTQTTVSVDTSSKAALSPANELGQFRYLIEFAEPGLVHQAGRASGERIDVHAPEMRAAQQRLQTRQAAHRQTMEGAVGRTLEITHHYLVSHSGMALWLTADEAEAIARLDGIVSVERERVYELDTYRGPEFIGAGAIWDGSAVPNESQLRGEDMVIAVIDTGVDPGHPSFANDAACGHGDGGTPDKLLSFLDCHATGVGGVCNGPSPQDGNGHGSHTASTAGGNALDGSAVPAPPIDITGVAPCAHIRSYRACGPGPGCNGAALTAALNNVLMSDADVLNFSISGGTSPWSASDGDRIKLDLVDAGIFVAASAGNTSATVTDPVGQVNHRGPWVMSVAASTHDGMFANPLSLDGGPSGVPAVEGTGSVLADDYTGPLHWAGDAAPGNENGCSAFPGGAFSGEAALIERGDCNFSDKINNAVAAGADFVVVYNNAGGPPIIMGGLEGTAVSSFMVTAAAGADLIAALGGATANVTVLAEGAFSFDPGLGDVLANFSFRGPTPAPLQHLQKPDITGPGVQILAAVPGGYDFIGGTSMSSPHLAGSAALVRQAHPGWSVSEVKSAIQMTASKSGLKDDGAGPWDWDDVGSGRVDLSKAALAGLVMDETVANYLAANPAGGSIDVRDLNLASVRDMECDPDCSWTRTVRNTLSEPSSWTVSTDAVGFDIEVSPSTFSFTGDTGETQELTITATPVDIPSGTIAFGEVSITEDGGLSPDLHLTAAIAGKEVPEIGVDPASLSSTLPQNQSEMQTLTISNSGDADLNWGIIDSGDGQPWSDDFDSYANGSQMHGQGGWKGWFDDPGAGALVSDEVANSTPHSVEIVGPTDLVREYTDIDAGQWVITAQQYIPGDFSGETFFILLNSYDDAGSNLNWSTEVRFDSVTDTVSNQGLSGGSMPLIRDQWVELRVEIDLSANTQAFYYDGGLLYSGTWTEEQSGNGALNLGAIDLFANGASEVYYDDIELAENTSPGCDTPSDVPWLSAAPLSGTTPPGGDSDVGVTFDPAGIAVGDYNAILCIASNDPGNDLVEVPVSLEVTEAVDLPVAAITPDSFEFVVPAGGSDDDVLAIGNTGEADLIWSIEFGEVEAGQILWPNGQATEVSTTEPSGETQGLARAGHSESEATGAHSFVEPRGDEVTITHSDSLDVAAANAVACANEGPPQTTVDNQFLRTFTLDDFDIAGDFNVTEVTFGIENLTANIDLTVNLYTLEGAFTYANLTLIGTATETATPQDLTLFTIPVEGTAAAGSTLVVEIVAPTLLGEGEFFPGSNSAGETASSFIASNSCSIAEPTTYADIGFPQVHLVMTVTGTESVGGCSAAAEIPWLSVDTDSGSTPPDGSMPVSVEVDAAGLAPADYEAQLCVNTNDPTAPLVEVPVSLTVTDEQPEPGELAVDPVAVDFGDVVTGGSAVETVTVSNAAAEGAADIELTQIDIIIDQGVFGIDESGSCAEGMMLAPQESCTVAVSFSPDTVTAYSGTLRIAADGEQEDVTLSGNGVEPVDDIFSDRFEE